MNLLPSDTLFNIILLISIAVLLIIFGLLLASIYRFLSKWLVFLQKEKISGSEEIKMNAQKEAARVLDDARRKAMEIITQASAKAQNALVSVENLSKESKGKLSTEMANLVQNQAASLQKTSDELLNLYKSTLAKQKEESLENLEETSDDIEKELIQEVDEFKDLLHKETIDTQKEVEEKVLLEYKKIEKDLEAYKQKQMANINETIYDILQDVSKQVLGEALSMEDHQELVIKALSEAKDNNAFSNN